MNQENQELIYEMWCNNSTEKEIANFLFEHEFNYNNADTTSNQSIESYEEILSSVKDCIANNKSDWIREEVTREFYNSDDWEEDDRLTHIKRDD